MKKSVDVTSRSARSSIISRPAYPVPVDRSSMVGDGLRRYLSAEHGDVTIESIRRPNDGLSSETYLVRVAGLGGKVPARDLVVRVAPTVGLFPVYDLGMQARIQASAPAA